MKILLAFLLLGLFLKVIKILFSYTSNTFKGDIFLTRSNSMDYVNSLSSVSAEIPHKVEPAIAPLPVDLPKVHSTLVLLQSGIVDALGKQIIAQTPLKLTA